MEKLLCKSCSDVNIVLYFQLDSLHRQLIRLEERAKTRDKNLDAMLSRLEKFYENYTDIVKELNETIDEERSFKPIGGEVDAIRSQQEEFKVRFLTLCLNLFRLI